MKLEGISLLLALFTAANAYPLNSGKLLHLPGNSFEYSHVQAAQNLERGAAVNMLGVEQNLKRGSLGGIASMGIVLDEAPGVDENVKRGSLGGIGSMGIVLEPPEEGESTRR
jgi:hypothetical protein